MGRVKASLRLIISVTIGLLIFSTFAALLFVGVSYANFAPFHIESPGIDVLEPRPYPKLYVNPNVSVYFYYAIRVDSVKVASFFYSLNGTENNTLNSNVINFNNPKFIQYEVNDQLQNLTNGTHNVKVYSHFVNGTATKILDTDIVVDTTFTPPRPIIVSPLNHTTYNSNQIPAVFATNSTNFIIQYALDGSDYPPYHWATFKGNKTLPYLSEGSHVLRVLLSTEVYRTTSDKDIQKIYFNIVKANSTSSTNALAPDSIEEHGNDSNSLSYSILTLTAMGILCVSLTVGLLLKRKHKLER